MLTVNTIVKMIIKFCCVVRKYKWITVRALHALVFIKDAVKNVLNGEKVRKMSRDTGVDNEFVKTVGCFGNRRVTTKWNL